MNFNDKKYNLIIAHHIQIFKYILNYFIKAG